MRASLAPLLRLVVVIVGSLTACADPAANSPAQPRSQPPERPQSAADEPSAAPERVSLRPRFRVGERWIEVVELELYSARNDEAFGETPTMLERRRESFEITDVDGEGGALLRVKVERLELEPRDGARIDTERLEGFDPRYIERLALVGLPLTVRLDDDGATLEVTDEAALREAAERRWGELRAAAGLGAPSDEERGRWQDALDGELASTREWGLRPRLPREPLALGDTWSESITTSSMFRARVGWTIEHRLAAADTGRVTIAREGVAELQASDLSARYIASASGTLDGEVILDRRGGALLESLTDLHVTLDARPQPEAGFPGGTLKMHRILRRRRVE